MASQYSLAAGSNGTNGTQLGRLFGDVVRTMIPIVMAAFAIYQTNVTHREQEEALRVEVQQLKDTVTYINTRYVSRDDMRDLLEPMREASTDQKAAIRDLENWLRNQQGGRGNGHQQPN